MKYIVVNSLKLFFPIFISLIFLQNTVYAEYLNPDEWEWELLEVRGGHDNEGSVIAENSGYLQITKDISNSTTGSLTVNSTGLWSDGQECVEEYVLAWNVPNALDRLPLAGDTEIQIVASATGTGTVPDKHGQCDTSYDSLNAAGGIKGVMRPIFLQYEPEKWASALQTTGSVFPQLVHGFKNPHFATGIITFPYLSNSPEENYPDYATFRIYVQIAHNNVGDTPVGTLAYTVIYTYKRVRKQVSDNSEVNWFILQILRNKLKK